MHQRDEVKVILQRIVIAELLVAAVTLIDGVRQNTDRETDPGIANSGTGLFKRTVGGCVIYDEYLSSTRSPSSAGTRFSTESIVRSALYATTKISNRFFVTGNSTVLRLRKKDDQVRRPPLLRQPLYPECHGRDANSQ